MGKILGSSFEKLKDIKEIHLMRERQIDRESIVAHVIKRCQGSWTLRVHGMIWKWLCTKDTVMR